MEDEFYDADADDEDVEDSGPTPRDGAGQLTSLRLASLLGLGSSNQPTQSAVSTPFNHTTAPSTSSSLLPAASQFAFLPEEMGTSPADSNTPTSDRATGVPLDDRMDSAAEGAFIPVHNHKSSSSPTQSTLLAAKTHRFGLIFSKAASRADLTKNRVDILAVLQAITQVDPAAIFLAHDNDSNRPI